MSINRRKARIAAMQALFQLDQNPDSEPASTDAFLTDRLRTPALLEYGLALVAGVREHRAAIDELLGQSAQNWRVERMPGVDRNVLRVAVFELRHRPDVPPKTVINEAIEIAKRYSTGNSQSFVNGVLDRLARNLGIELTKQDGL